MNPSHAERQKSPAVQSSDGSNRSGTGVRSKRAGREERKNSFSHRWGTDLSPIAAIGDKSVPHRWLKLFLRSSLPARFDLTPVPLRLEPSLLCTAGDFCLSAWLGFMRRLKNQLTQPFQHG